MKIHTSGQASTVTEIHHVDTHPHGHEEIQFVIPLAFFSDAVLAPRHDGGDELDSQDLGYGIAGLQEQVAMIAEINEPPQGAQRAYFVAHSADLESKDDALDDKAMEEWYDELYQMILLAYLKLDHEQRKPKISHLKDCVSGGILL